MSRIEITRWLATLDAETMKMLRPLMDAYAAFGFRRGDKPTGSNNDVYSAWLGDLAANMPWMIDRAVVGISAVEVTP